MSDYGIKVSQNGYDAATCPDYKLVFNSSWPLLKILDSGVFTNAASPSLITSYALDYVPAFWWFSDGKVGTQHTPGVSSFGSTFNGQLAASNSALSFRSGYGANTLSGRYYIFALDIETAYTSPSIVLPTVADIPAIADTDYGIRISKPGKSINSTDLRDFSVNSNARTPMVHSVTPGTKAASPSSITVTHNLGYAPMGFVYVKLTGESDYILLTGADDSNIGVSNTTLTFFLPYACDYSVVILKDPLLLN